MHGKLELHFDEDIRISKRTLNELDPNTESEELGEKKLAWIIRSAYDANCILKKVSQMLKEIVENKSCPY